MRKMKRLPLEELRPYLLETPEPATQLDLGAIFGNDSRRGAGGGFRQGHVSGQLGRGSCRQSTTWASRLSGRIQLYTATRLAKRKLTNVRLACTDARAFLRDHVPDRSFQAVHVYFPDPWWKKRHHKRRLFNDEFAAQCTRVLRDGGRLHVVSDVAEYFSEIQEILAKMPLHPVPPTDLKEPTHDLDYLTNFERKYRKEARPIYRETWMT